MDFAQDLVAQIEPNTTVINQIESTRCGTFVIGEGLEKDHAVKDDNCWRVVRRVLGLNRHLSIFSESTSHLMHRLHRLPDLDSLR